MDKFRHPADCHTMSELRQQIDALDEDLVALLALRSRFIGRATVLKEAEGLPARVTDRVAEVLDKVSAAASERELDPDLARTLWTEIIEWSIQRESEVLGGSPSTTSTM